MPHLLRLHHSRFLTLNLAFMTACGHNYCYECINTYIQGQEQSQCPVCSASVEKIFPNILLDKLLKRPALDLDNLSSDRIIKLRQNLTALY